MTRQTKTLFRSVLHLCHHPKVGEMDWNKRPACFQCADTGFVPDENDSLLVKPCSCEVGKARAEMLKVKPERTPDELEAMAHHPSAYGKKILQEMKDKLN